MLADIEHPFADGEPVHDITFENVQAGERTSHLFRLANLHRALLANSQAAELLLAQELAVIARHASVRA